MITIKLLEYDEKLINADKCITPEKDRIYCEDALDYFFDMIRSDKIESSIIINLDEKGNIINYCKHTSNDANRVDVPFSELFAPTLISKAKSVVYMHNHTLQKYEYFSEGDILFTRSMAKNLAEYEIIFAANFVVMPDGKVLEYDEELLAAYRYREVFRKSKEKYELLDRAGITIESKYLDDCNMVEVATKNLNSREEEIRKMEEELFRKAYQKKAD